MSPQLIDIQSDYFNLLDLFFAKPFAEMTRHRSNPAKVAARVASAPGVIKAFTSEAHGFAEGVRDFWKENGPIVDKHVAKMQGLKCFFGGDVFPSYQRNIATSVGLYMDTVLLPDPLLKLCDFIGHADPAEIFRLITKHALNAMSYRDLALAPIDPPVVVIVPNHSLREEDFTNTLMMAAQTDALEHASRIFDRSFESAEEFRGFLDEFRTNEDIANRVVNSSRLLFDTEWSGPPALQLERYQRETMDVLGGKIAKAPVSLAIWNSTFGRMMQANDLLLGSSQVGGVPLVDAPTSWQYLLWKYEYDGVRTDEPKENGDLVFVKVLEVEGQRNLSLISGVSSQVLIDLRKNGAGCPMSRDFRDMGIVSRPGTTQRQASVPTLFPSPSFSRQSRH